MPELSIVIMHQCKSFDHPPSAEVGGYSQLGLHTGDATCTCKGFKFTKRVNGVRKPCKHIREAEEITPVCQWHEMYGIPQTEKGVCPECGGPTTPVKVGV